MKYNQTHSVEKQQYNGIDLDYSLIPTKTALPSKGSFYPFKYIYIRGLRFREQLEITQLETLQDQALKLDSVMRVYRECVKTDNPDYTLDHLLYEDLYAICMWIILLTDKDQKWSIIDTCQHCSNEVQLTLETTSDIDLKEMELDEPQIVDTELGKLVIAPRTIGEGLEYNTIADPFKQELSNSQMIKKRNGTALSLQERLEVYGLLSLQEVNKIDEICSKFKVYINPINKPCPKCQKQITLRPLIDITRGCP